MKPSVKLSSVIGYHLVAFLTVAIWGSTFVFTKLLLQNGLSPAQIFTLRFIIAYVLMVTGCLIAGRRFRLFSHSWRDELILFPHATNAYEVAERKEFYLFLL